MSPKLEIINVLVCIINITSVPYSQTIDQLQYLFGSTNTNMRQIRTIMKTVSQNFVVCKKKKKNFDIQHLLTGLYAETINGI